MNRFHPLCSAKVFARTAEETQKNLDLIRFPTWCSVKWDGWRIFEFGGKATCRSMKPPRNVYTQKKLGEFFSWVDDNIGLRGLDGELMVGDIWDHNVMQNTTSGLNTIAGEPDFTYQIFDSYQDAQCPFAYRLGEVLAVVERAKKEFPWIRYTEHRQIQNMEQLLAYLDEVVAMGGEGIMGRDPHGHYKMGRSTMRDGILWALKPYMDDEAEIIGFEEEMENQNLLERDALGYAKRSGHKENMVPKGRLGKFICRSPKFPETFSVGSGVGLTHALRQEVWDSKPAYLGRWLKYKYQAIGVKERPRQPKFMGFRSELDMEIRS